MSYETAVYQWRDGERRLQDAGAPRRAVLDRVSGRIVVELRRRLGGRFTTEELVELYERGTSWCLDLAIAAAPQEPWAWDSRVVADAAFATYLREAVDYAGGRRDARQS